MLSEGARVMLLVIGAVFTLGHPLAGDFGLVAFGCSGRLERALEALQRESGKRVRLEEEEAASLAYQQQLRSAPFEMIVSRINVKLPREKSGNGEGQAAPWARVERCVFEPSDDSLRTRVTFKDMSVTGMVSLHPRDLAHHPLATESSCRMILRLRQAGIEFLTTPISRGHGQMRIRTESNFMEPRFASIYAYGCHPTTRLDKQIKQIKRQDKWPPRHASSHHQGTPMTVVEPSASLEGYRGYQGYQGYEAAEPRTSLSYQPTPLARNHSRALFPSIQPNAALWRKNLWITKSSERKRRWSKVEPPEASSKIASTIGWILRERRSVQVITPEDFAKVLMDQTSSSSRNKGFEVNERNVTTTDKPLSVVSIDQWELKSTSKRENHQEIPRENRELLFEDKHQDVRLSSVEHNDADADADADAAKIWESKEYVLREMEDVFLRGASQALTRYIERQLHPAIKETLMLSMGYTISYG